MNKETTRQAEADEEILNFNVPDDALERAASAAGGSRHLGILHSPLVLLPVATVAN